MKLRPHLPRRPALIHRAVQLLWCLPLSIASAAHAQRINPAKFQPATANSVNTSYLANFATDGIVSNFHSPRTNNITSSFFTLEFTYRHKANGTFTTQSIGLKQVSKVTDLYSCKDLTRQRNDDNTITIKGVDRFNNPYVTIFQITLTEDVYKN
jgi:hypothetical protein